MEKKTLIFILIALLLSNAVACGTQFNGETDLKRDSFETVEAFKLRIGKLKPQIVGEVKLIKDKYDISSGKFPLQVTFEPWFLSVMTSDGEFFITVDGKLAKSIYDASETYPLYGKLAVNGEKISVTSLEIHAKRKVIPVNIPSEALRQ